MNFEFNDYKLYLDGFEIQEGGDYLDQIGNKKILEEIEESNTQHYFEDNCRSMIQGKIEVEDII